MTSKPVPVYWDSCVYIDCIQEEPSRYPELRKVISEAEGGKIVLVASTAVIAEVVKLKQSADPLQQQVAKIHDFFENDYLEFKAVDRSTADDAANLCRLHGLRPMDAIHVATALRWECRFFQTYDGYAATNATTKTGRPYLLAMDGQIGQPRPLTIELPCAHFTQPTLGLNLDDSE
jgi:predicted nucleic acid-binding protein